jgi:hypothetical protein
MTSDARSGGAEPCDTPQESASPSDTADRMVELREEADQSPPDIRAALEDTLDKYGPTQIPDSHPAP